MGGKVRGAPIDEQIRVVNAIARGDVLLVDLAGAKGKELRSHHFCAVVSNDTINQNTEFLVVVPLTTHDGKQRPRQYEVALGKGDGGLSKAGAAVPHLVRTIDPRERVIEVLGRLSDGVMSEIENMLAWVCSGEPPAVS